MSKILKFITDSDEALVAAKESNVSEVWINGSETFVTFDDTAELKTIPVSTTEVPKPEVKHRKSKSKE